MDRGTLTAGGPTAGGRSFAYDADSNLTTETLPSGTGVVDTLSYDNLDQMSGVTDTAAGNTFASFSYTRDGNSQLTGETSTGLGQSAQTYAYNSLNQLSAANSLNYTYDAGNNLTQMPSGATQAFDPANQLCWTSATTVSGGMCGTVPSGATSYSYDSRGNRTSSSPSGGTALNYTYDQADRLTGYGSSATYAYNGDGLRTSKTVSGTAEGFVWDQTSPVPLLLKDGGTSFIYGPDSQPLEQVTSSGTVTWLHHDQLGSTRVLTSSSGSVVGTASYDAYGRTTASTGPVTTPLGYAGGYTDAESGLVYLVNRYYDPATGQFLNVDPLVATTQAPYTYTSDNPLNLTDPLGLNDCGIFSVVCDVGHVVAGGTKATAHGITRAAKYAYHHPLQTVGVVAGGVAAVTGVGALADVGIAGVLSAETTETVAFASGTIASASDLPGCVKGDHLSCVGAAGGFLGIGLNAASAGVDAFLSDSELVSGLLDAKGFSIGVGAGAWDLGVYLSGFFGQEEIACH